MLYTIKKIGNGWYSFKDIPQGYIKIDGLNCESDKKAMKYGWKLLKNNGVDVEHSALCFEGIV